MILISSLHFDKFGLEGQILHETYAHPDDVQLSDRQRRSLGSPEETPFEYNLTLLWDIPAAELQSAVLSQRQILTEVMETLCY